MAESKFRILYREFLFRVVDLELLAPQGDMRKLLGQFAGLLLFISFWVLMFPALGVGGSPPSELSLFFTWGVEQFLIATTMLVVGLLAVLSWESLFPDRRDVMVLLPLPVRARTILGAKIAAVAAALAVSILCLNIFPGIAAPLSFATAPTVPASKYDAAMPPVALADLKPVLDRDMNAARAPGSDKLALGANAGVVVGVLQHGRRRIFTFGHAHPDSIFQIGSVTKTFTALLLAQMVDRGKVRLDEPVRDLLPQGIVPKPKRDEITLLDLATQHSGLPSMPDNFNPEDTQNPYVDYHAANLYAYLAKRGVGRPANPPFVYSNLGLAVLGQALSNTAGTTYANLVKQEITDPLAMSDTGVSLSPDQRPRLIQGHSGDEPHDAVRPWDFDAFAGAGAISSTAGDMLTYLEAQLHPEKFASLAAALVASHQLRRDAAPMGAGQSIALAWVYDPGPGIYWHNGATAGYTSYAFFCPGGEDAAVVLINTGPNLILNPGQLAEHIRERLDGQPAISLATEAVSGRGSPLNIMRSFAAYWFTVFAAGAFVFCFVLTLQGFAQLLPRQMFLRVSSFLQVGCFCLFLTVYFLQPFFAAPDTLDTDRSLLSWLPPYWFSSLFETLNGPIDPSLVILAKRAWIGLAVSICTAAGAYAICYYRTLRRIAEEPDIVPSSRRAHWLPPFGNPFETAIGQFAARALFRSRQHRMILSFYLGMAIGLAMFMSKIPLAPPEGLAVDLWNQINAPLLMASVLVMCAAVLGIRVVFSLPLELRANWIFQVTPAGAASCAAATRRALYGLAALPVWTFFAAMSLCLWPWKMAIAHLLVLALVGILVCELSLRGFQKIPFACSYQPGKSQLHMTLLAFVVVLVLIGKGVAFELGALGNPFRYAAMLSVLVSAALVACWWARATNSRHTAPHFEDDPEPAILELKLHERGVLPIVFPNPK
ncbi:MAG TPA: serine hydrolase domain-containing protein [Candidatus Aquilonibacter sp.]|nr:serine hydrolase domain-containing protein [Candidatus Aquilonibacter sp.]